MARRKNDALQGCCGGSIEVPVRTADPNAERSGKLDDRSPGDFDATAIVGRGESIFVMPAWVANEIGADAHLVQE